MIPHGACEVGRIVVTGAGGLVGRSVVRQLLADGHEVVAVVRPGSRGVLADSTTAFELDLATCTQADLSALGHFDGVIHLAQAPGWHNFPAGSGDIAAVALASTARLAEAAVTVGAKWFVLASSGGIYGPSEWPIAENAEQRGGHSLGFYLSAKAAAERLLGFFSPHLGVTILRPFFIYGPGQADSFLMPRLVASVREGRPITLDGGRGPRMNPIWHDDAATAFVAAGKLAVNDVINLAGPETMTLREIAQEIGSILGVVPTFRETSEEPSDYVADIGRQKTYFGVPPTDMRSGLIQFLDCEKKGRDRGTKF